jgi:hypothetical protein
MQTKTGFACFCEGATCKNPTCLHYCQWPACAAGYCWDSSRAKENLLPGQSELQGLLEACSGLDASVLNAAILLLPPMQLPAVDTVISQK